MIASLKRGVLKCQIVHLKRALFGRFARPLSKLPLRIRTLRETQKRVILFVFRKVEGDDRCQQARSRNYRLIGGVGE